MTTLAAGTIVQVKDGLHGFDGLEGIYTVIRKNFNSDDYYLAHGIKIRDMLSGDRPEWDFLCPVQRLRVIPVAELAPELRNIEGIAERQVPEK
jgi:hypothetical protein